MSLPIAIVASGNGTNAQAMIDLMKAGVLDVDIRLIFCNRPGAPVLERARKAGVPSRMLDHTKFPDRASFDREMASIIKESGAELVVLAGYMRLLTDDFLKEFPHRVINIHPSILPGFGGSIHAGQEAVDYGVKLSGCTVHVVEMKVDSGPVIIQAAVPCTGVTGVEIEALTAVSVAALTIYDMCKAVQKDMKITNLRLLEKTGGKSGDYRAEE